MDYSFQTLRNGIRVVHHQSNSPVAYCCIMINTGTRDELENEHGLAHYIEHVIFKGTKKRKAYHVMSRLEDVGGELNAYTTKEETVIHATVLKDDFHRAVELISDIVFRSTFPEKELEREKEVILDEINSYKDSPSELIYDEFEELIFPNHPFGRNILGTKKHLKQFNRDKIENFITRTYNSDQMVFCSIGNIHFGKVLKLAERYFGDIKPNPRGESRMQIDSYSAKNLTVKKSTYQKHCIIGCPSYSLTEAKRIGMHLLNNVLGGPGLNSRLNLSLRERKGIAYNVESVYTPYSDTGVFSIYFGTDKTNFEKAQDIVHAELNKLRTKRMGILQLFKAKKQIIGQLAISMENSETLMLNMARSILVYNSIDSMQVVSSRIDKITDNDLMEIANEVLTKDNLSTLIYK